MIGRAAELQVLRDAFAAGRTGEPRAVVVRGEAGIGKTRLLLAFRDDLVAAPSSPPVVLAVGQCVDLGTIGAPFTPIRRMLRELYLGVGDDAFRGAAQTPAVIATLSTLVPDLAPDIAPPSGGGDFVYEAIERVIENLSAQWHLVLIIEDLHWADAATLDLLRTLAVTLRGTHVTMVLTYRSDDVGRGHPLRGVLAELDRSRLVSGIGLARLTPDEVAQQARLIAGDLPPEVVAALVARSDGVPFFVEELVDLKDPADLPDTLRDLVLARFQRLSEPAKDVVGVVAAGGVHVDHAVLEEVHAGDGGSLREGLREALAANVLVSEREGYAFRHALIQEAVHDDLLPSERTELHARYAAAIQRRADDGAPTLAAAAAEHWLAARDIPRAFDATLTARTHASVAFAMSTSALLGERLLDLWPQVADAAGRAGSSRAALAAIVAEEWLDTNDTPRGLRIARAALATADEDDVLGRARLHIAISKGRRDAGDMPGAVAAGESAIALLEGGAGAERDVLLSRALGSHSIARRFAGLPIGHDELERARALAEAVGDEEGRSQALHSEIFRRLNAGDLDGAVDGFRLVTTTDPRPATRLRAAANLIDTLLLLGRYPDAVEEGTRGLEAANEVGLERALGASLGANLAEAHLAAGDVRSADSLLRRSRELLVNTPAWRSFVDRQRALWSSWDDRQQEADEIRSREDAFIADITRSDLEERIGWAEFDVESALNAESSRIDAAVATAVAVLTDEGVVGSPSLARRLIPGAARAAERGRAEGAYGADRLATAIDDILSAQTADAPTRALRLLVDALATGDAAAWHDAVTSLDMRALPVRHLHYARYRLAEALVAADDRDEAAALVELLIAGAPAHGVALMARRSRELAARAGLTIEGTDAAAHAMPTASGVSFLTPRELQVLALVAEGLTNPQIGQRLFISPKTASVHVSAILAKIGAANRAEAAALYATQEG